MAIEPWKRIEPTIVTKIDRKSVVLKTFIAPDDNQPATYATWLNEDYRGGGVIAITKDMQVVVARQFRHGPELIMDEIPGGVFDVGEDPEAGACRELLEETGYKPGSITFLGINTRDAYTNGTWYYYLATDCKLTDTGQKLDHNEDVEVRLISIEDFIDNAKQNRMTDPAAVLMAYDKLKELQEGK